QVFAIEQASVMGCCLSGMAMSALGTLSGALDHNFALRVMRHGSWWAHPRLWILLVGPPSAKKTPIINAATAPLMHYEQYRREGYLEKLALYERAQEEEDDSVPEPEKPPRYVVWDTTVEALGEILARGEGKGLLVKADELSGWLGAMERYA